MRLVVLSRPVEGDLIGVRIEPVFVRISMIVWLGGDIDHDRFFRGYRFESVINMRRNDNQQRIMFPCRKFVNHLISWRVYTRIIQDQFSRALNAEKVVGLNFMIMPGLDHTGIGRGEINLAEFFEYVAVGAQDFRQPTSLISDYLHQPGMHAVDQLHLDLSLTSLVSAVSRLAVGERN